jgi:TolB-like protein
MSEKHDQEYFGDGMAEEILNVLVKGPSLEVIGRTSSFQFKGKTDDLRKIGNALGAAYVVEGSVRRSGERMRVTAQLIDTQDGSRRWSNTYNTKTDDVFEVQEAIAAGISPVVPLAQTHRTPAPLDRADIALHALSSSGTTGAPGGQVDLAPGEESRDRELVHAHRTRATLWGLSFCRIRANW